MTNELEQFEKDGKNLNRQAGHRRPKTGEDEEFRIETVRCDICFSIIGKCDMSKFDVPMTGTMFISKDHKHGYPAPFYGRNFDWMELRCPICNKRPFTSRNYFHNRDGEKCGFTYECPICEKGFINGLALAGHKGQVHPNS
jgi:hypothetical protein